MEYENKSNWILGENKPKTNPISVKPKMNANAFSQGDYENEARLQTGREQSQSKPISKSQIGFGL